MPFLQGSNPAIKPRPAPSERIRQKKRRRLWIVLDRVVYATNDGLTVKVDPGFFTDLTSMPRILLPFAHREGSIYTAPAIIHDMMYESGRVSMAKDAEAVTRTQADTIYRNAMLDRGASRASAYARYYGVRFGGWRPWNRYRKLDGV
ncbi:DUF1353 domain-containing protein [bacterium]|nr:DUF1353 domain-containing protein [bacterium]